MELFRQTNIDFLRYKWWAILASWALILVGVFAIFVQKGLKFGIDFAGGTAIALKFSERPDIDRLRKILDGASLGETGIQSYEEAEKNQVLIRVEQQKKEGRDVAREVLAAVGRGLQVADAGDKLDLNTMGQSTLAARLSAADPDRMVGNANVSLTAADHYARVAERVLARRSEVGLFRSPAEVARTPELSLLAKEWIQANTYAGPFVLLSAENVGPQVGSDLQKKALYSVFWSTMGMLAYIAVRFRSFPFGVGAVVATIHDVLITVGLLALLGREFNLVTVAALLTLVGYSVNDTVVVYDRIRENLRSPKKELLETVINRSINQTLSRTILTSGATMLVVVALFFLGGAVLNTFALTLIIGIIVGTYSSIYVASPIVVIWKNFANRRKLAAVPVAASKVTASASQPPSKKKNSGR
jgi:preprotein translocase subunit SecF